MTACVCGSADPSGDRGGVRHRRVPRGDGQHLRRLWLGADQEQLSGGDHGHGGLHQLLHHHAAQRGECQHRTETEMIINC